METAQIEESHTADNIGALLVAITDRWNITEKVCCVMTDNANNMVAAIRHNKWNHLPLQEVPEVSEVMQRCKNIVSYFHKSCKTTDKLTAIQY